MKIMWICGLALWSFTAAVQPAVYTFHGPFISRSTFDRLLGLAPSPANALEFCAGTFQEMAGADVYEVAERYSRERAIAYVHCRNVVGKAPNSREVFIDEGDMDAPRLLRVLHRNGFGRCRHPRPRAADGLRLAVARRRGTRVGLFESCIDRH